MRVYQFLFDVLSLVSDRTLRFLVRVVYFRLESKQSSKFQMYRGLYLFKSHACHWSFAVIPLTGKQNMVPVHFLSPKPAGMAQLTPTLLNSPCPEQDIIAEIQAIVPDPC